MSKTDTRILEVKIRRSDEEISVLQYAEADLGLQPSYDDLTIWAPIHLDINRIESKVIRDDEIWVTMKSGERWTIRKTNESEKILGI